MKIFGVEFKFNGFDIWHSGNFNPTSKSDVGHTHVKANITDFPTSLPANGGNADTVDGKHYSDITNYVASKGDNLVTNGTGLLGNNTNFSGFTFDGSDSYFAKGSFKDSTYNTVRFSDEMIPVDVNKRYKLSLYAKTNPYVGAKYYIGIAEFDYDGYGIEARHHMYFSGTLTTLAQDLKPGDTVVYLTSSQNWRNAAGSNTHERSIIFWGYKNSSGYEYPPETYSRYYSGYDTWLDGAVDYVNNCITLKNPWSYTNPNDPQGIWRAGTKLSNGSSGGTYKYITPCVYSVIPNTWTNYTGCIGGIDTTGTNDYNKFTYGTVGVKLLFSNNKYVTGSTVWYSNISFGLDVALTSDIPTKTSQLTNDSGFITSSASITGNASTATKLQTARTISLSGGVTGSTSFDGSANISISTTVNSHTHAISDVTNLQTTLDGKAAISHTHTKSQITDMPTKLSDFINDTGYITSAQAGTIITISNTQPLGSKIGDIWIQTL